MLRRCLSPVASVIALVIIVIVGVVLVYSFLSGLSGRVSSRGGTQLPQVVVDAASYPSTYEIVVSSTGSQPVLSQPIKLFVRNIGDVPVRVDTIYIETSSGLAVLSYRLPKPVTIPPKGLAIIELNVTYSQYQKLLSAIRRYGYLELVLGSASGASTSVPLTYLPSGRLSLSNIVFSMYLVIVNCSDAAGWWVNVAQLIQDAESATSKIRGLQVVIINSSRDLYYLFSNYTAIGYAPNGTPVRVYLGGKRAVIVDAHGEVLPLPPQFVRDIDGDGKAEVEVLRYAQMIRNALESNPWILVSAVGAPLYYLSNNNFVYDSSYQLYFVNGSQRIPVDATFLGVESDRIRWSIQTDANENLEFQVRFGEGNPKLITLDRRLVYYLVTGSWSDSGPDWLSLEIRWEPRLAINGKSWHNFANEYVVGWGGAAALKATPAVSTINKFFGASLPPTISAARALPSNYPSWFDSAKQYLYATSGYSLVSKAMLHYDDLSTDSISYLDAGNNRNMPYWRIAWGSASVANGVMSLSSDTLVMRNLVGWADFGYSKGESTYSYLGAHGSTGVVYSFSISASGSGYACIVLGNGTSSDLAVLNLTIDDGYVTGIYLVNASASSGSLVPNSVYAIATGINVSVSSSTPVSIYFNGSDINVTIGSYSTSSKWVGSGVDLNNTLIIPGFANIKLQTLDIGGPIEVYAKHVILPAGKASAAIPIGEGMLVIGGYSPPQGVVKEYGYSYSQVDTKYIADAAIYFPLYIVLKEVGVNIDP